MMREKFIRLREPLKEWKRIHEHLKSTSVLLKLLKVLHVCAQSTWLTQPTSSIQKWYLDIYFNSRSQVHITKEASQKVKKKISQRNYLIFFCLYVSLNILKYLLSPQQPLLLWMMATTHMAELVVWDLGAFLRSSGGYPPPPQLSHNTSRGLDS